jgi:hypothetical protein
MSFTHLNWASDLGNIASRFAAYRSLMHHWERVLPVPVLQVDYEEIVSDFETTARAMIDWCGLDWEPACLDFHEAKGIVRTASLAQVRQPIYRRSVGRWRNYEEQLGPLLGQLNEIDTLGFDSERPSPSDPELRRRLDSWVHQSQTAWPLITIAVLVGSHITP